jgi:hypothetical protein
MKLSAEQLLAIVRDYWPSEDLDIHCGFKRTPEVERFEELWKRELEKIGQWRAFLASFRAELPEFTLSDITAPVDASFRCGAYAKPDPQQPQREWIVVGCLSILAPVYTVYGVQYTEDGKKRSHELFFEPLPPEMRVPADLIARRIEARFEATALPRELAETPIPLYVEPRKPPDTTLFHALFIGDPERVP